MWGILSITISGTPKEGITPTSVGNTLARLVSTKEVEDHPHQCGEYHTRPASGRFLLGSPPPVWGIRMDKNALDVTYRITPTSVGNTCFCLVSFIFFRDHPHQCGEYYFY